MLATERLAADLITRREFPTLSDDEIRVAREHLAHAFQRAWIEQSQALRALVRHGLGPGPDR